MAQGTLDDLLIPTAKAEIFWCLPRDHDKRQFAVAVLLRPAKEVEDCVFARVAKDSANFPRSDGAHCASWLTQTTPEHVFAAIAADLGELPPREHRAAFWELVRQFARIEGCGWARRMYEQRGSRPLTRDDLKPFIILQDGQRVPLD